MIVWLPVLSFFKDRNVCWTDPARSSEVRTTGIYGAECVLVVDKDCVLRKALFSAHPEDLLKSMYSVRQENPFLNNACSTG